MMIKYKADVKRLIRNKFPNLTKNYIFQAHLNLWLDREKTMSDIKDYIIILNFVADVNYVALLTTELSYNPSETTNTTHIKAANKYGLSPEVMEELEDLFQEAKKMKPHEESDDNITDNLSDLVDRMKEKSNENKGI